MFRFSQAFSVFLLSAILVVGQELTNESVIAMVRAGVGEDAVTYAVANQTGKYLLSYDALLALRKAGVSNTVISTMLAKATAPPTIPSVPQATALSSSSATSAPTSTSYVGRGSQSSADQTDPPRKSAVNLGTPEKRQMAQATPYHTPRTRQKARRRPGVVRSSALVGGDIGSGVGRVVGGTVGVGFKLGGMTLRIAAPTAIAIATRAALAGLL
jgi:hypothetical protein